MSAPNATGGALSAPPVWFSTDDPPSLRRRAPAHVDIGLISGRYLTITRRKVHLRAGQSVIVQVVPQSPSDKVEIAAEPPLHTVLPASRVEGGPVPTYHAEFSGRSLMRFPIPTTGKLHVRIIDGLPNPCRITIPFTVWPAHATLVLWWLVAFLGIIGLRWQKIAADGNSYERIFEALWHDLPYSLGLLGLGFLVLIPLRLIGWLVSLMEQGEDSD